MSSQRNMNHKYYSTFHEGFKRVYFKKFLFLFILEKMLEWTGFGY